MVNPGLFSSEKQEWGTPDGLFLSLDGKFHFKLDPCATAENAKCENFFTKEVDGLKQKWFGPVFMNPPYGRGLYSWIQKANFEHQEEGVFIVGLLPARTDTRWFWLMKNKKNVHIEFLPGRLKFKGAKYPAPFPSMLVYWL